MPVMDGLEATRSIRALPRGDAAGTPILAMTANAFDEDRTQAYRAGMTGYLTKPLDIQMLLEALGDLLPARSAAQARQTPTSGGNGAAEKTKKPPAE